MRHVNVTRERIQVTEYTVACPERGQGRAGPQAHGTKVFECFRTCENLLSSQILCIESFENIPTAAILPSSTLVDLAVI